MVVQEAGIDYKSKFFIMRFVGWDAAHDRSEKGISYENKINFVKELAKYGRVLISSEERLPDGLSTLPIASQH